MNILITGVNSFIGKSLYQRLKQSHSVYGIYNTGIYNNESFIKCNLKESTSSVEQFIKDKNIKIDCILHNASMMASADNLNDLKVLHDNAQISFLIAQLAIKLKVQRVINFSSSSVYSNIDGTYNENMPTEPYVNSDWIYGLSKINSENIINALLLNWGIEILHLRICNVYGEGMNQTRLIPVLTQELRLNNTITIFGEGKRLQNIIKLETLINYLEIAINKNISGTYNVVEETLSIKDIANRIINELGNSDSKIIVNPQGNKSAFILDGTKFFKLIFISHEK